MRCASRCNPPGPPQMIDDLTVAKTAAFFIIRKKLSNRAIADLFRSTRAVHSAHSHNIFRHTRERAGEFSLVGDLL